MSESPNVAKYALICLTIPGCFVLEHIGRLNDWPIKPSVPLGYANDCLKTFFSFIGKQAAIVSSFLTLIDISELKKTFYDITAPFFGIITSPTYSIKSYIETALTYQLNSWQIYLGSFCICAVIVAAIWYLNKTSRLDKIKSYAIEKYSKLLSN
jgi:hypothetical protein